MKQLMKAINDATNEAINKYKLKPKSSEAEFQQSKLVQKKAAPYYSSRGGGSGAGETNAADLTVTLLTRPVFTMDIRLPVAVTDVFSVSRIGTALFSSNTQLILCRNRDIIWIVRQPAPATSIAWSGDSAFVAVVFDDGRANVYSTETGRVVVELARTKSRSSDEGAKGTANSTKNEQNADTDTDRISAVAWSSTSDGESQIEHETGMVPAACGTFDGNLRVTLHGTFTLPDIAVGTGKVSGVAAYELSGRYIALVDDNIVTVKPREDLPRENSYAALHAQASSHAKIEEVAANAAEAAKAVDTALQAIDDHMFEFFHLIRLTAIPAEELPTNATTDPTASVVEAMYSDPIFDSAYQKRLTTNIESEAGALKNFIRTHMIMLVLTHSLTPILQAWIAARHEQGFLKWYKGVTHEWDIASNSLDRLLQSLHELLPLVQSLVSATPVSASEDSTAPQNIVEAELQMLVVAAHRISINLHAGRQVFEPQAAFLEYIFSEEISRPIGAAQVQQVSNEDLLRDLSTSRVFGVIPRRSAAGLVNTMQGLQKRLAIVHEGLQARLRNSLTVSTLPLGEPGRLLTVINDSCYVSVDGEVLQIDGLFANADGMSASAGRIHPLDFDADVVVPRKGRPLPIAARNGHLVSNGTPVKNLGFWPASVTACAGNDHIKTCMLSADRVRCIFFNL